MALCTGAMERFVSSAEERGALVGGMAAECERAAQLDWAVELYLYARQPGAALALINDQLSNALQPALSGAAKGKPWDACPQPLKLNYRAALRDCEILGALVTACLPCSAPACHACAFLGCI